MLYGEQVSYLPQVWGKPRCRGRLQQVTCPRCRREMSVRWLAPGSSPGPEKAPGKDRALCLGAHCYAATAVWGAVSWRSRTHDPRQSRAQDSSWRVAMEAAGRGEHGPLPQPVTSLQLSFSRQLHPPPQRGPARPPSRACPCLTKGNQICCSCSVREQALPETGEAAGERFLPARGCKYLYNVVRGKGENRGRWQERGGTETAD